MSISVSKANALTFIVQLMFLQATLHSLCKLRTLEFLFFHIIMLTGYATASFFMIGHALTRHFRYFLARNSCSSFRYESSCSHKQCYFPELIGFFFSVQFNSHAQRLCYTFFALGSWMIEISILSEEPSKYTYTVLYHYTIILHVTVN